ncbi:MAG TPA: ATP cone domain-containing protein [Thermoanaerobaculia bacterium]|nr:ATP cone domain-containing protein [Thermoanaerobaculia bacterium]
MECPYCGGSSKVVDSRPTADGIRRRRRCEACGKRFTTHERLAPADLRVVKLSGETEPFRSEKLVRVMRRVSRDLGVDDDRIRALARRIEAELAETAPGSIDSWDLAEILAERLGDLHPVARSRFLANYENAAGAIARPRRRQTDETAEQIGLFTAPEE